jgi:cellulose biosynthesis protein BcsQ
VKRILSREYEETQNCIAIDKLKIGIIGISNHVGVSFLTSCLARYLANMGIHSPAVAELGRGSLFDSCGMDKRFAGRPYFQFYTALTQNKSIRGKKNMDEGVNWLLKSPSEQMIRLTFEQKLRLANHAKGDVVLCDFSGEQILNRQLLQAMDQIIVVIDPMPSKMLEGHDFLQCIKDMERNKEAAVIYVINKFNRGVNRRQMLNYLNIKNPVIIPLVKTEIIYTAEYNCKIPYTLSEVKSVLQKSLTEIYVLLNESINSSIL